MFILRWLAGLFVMATIVAVAIAGYLFYDYKRFLQTPLVTANSDMNFVVAAGANTTTLTRALAKRGMVIAAQSPIAKQVGPYYFRYLAKTTGLAQKLKAGEYLLQEGMKARDVLELFASGNTVAYKVTFLEGWNLAQIRKQLAGNEHVEHTLANVSDENLFAALGIEQTQRPEGFFFPDTYHFPSNSKDRDVLRQAYQLMQTNLKKAWAARNPSVNLSSPYELLIMASLIEKETSVDAERNKVSGVFHRRLAKGMKLQTDPTIVYGLGDSYRGTIYRSDLKKDTPYNTYLHKGLPPTPIAMPGMASLMAAGNPDNSKALYFVATGEGGHTFSDTYKQHLRAVKAYRQALKKGQ